MSNDLYDVLEERVMTVLEENGEGTASGIAYALVDKLNRWSVIDIGIIYDFAEKYGCSIDYLLGRSDVYSVV
jgi:hypothetical protein